MTYSDGQAKYLRDQVVVVEASGIFGRKQGIPIEQRESVSAQNSRAWKTEFNIETGEITAANRKNLWLGLLHRFRM